MAAPLSSAQLTALGALLDLESQTTYILVALAEKQSAYNDANPSATKSQVSITPNYTTNAIAAQVAFPMKHDAVGRLLQDSIVAPLTGV